MTKKREYFTIRKDYVVEKRNVLNEIRSNKLSLQELRFFSIYLAKINARDPSTRVVRFYVSDFQRIMDYGKVNLMQIKASLTNLLCKVVELPLDEEEHFAMFHLFKRIVFAKDKNMRWYIEIDAHDDALPLMFDFRERYFTYKLWIALRLKSANQFRLYEIMKQYEHARERVISIEDLRQLLGLDDKEYARFDNFKARVLDACREAIEEYTDIKFTYEPAEKGSRGKILSLKFNISRNEKYVDYLALSDYINKDDLHDILVTDVEVTNESSNEDEDACEYEDEDDSYFTKKIYPLLKDSCRDEFSLAEIQVLYNLYIRISPYQTGEGTESYLLKAFDYFKRKYDELNWRTTRKDLEQIKSRFGYLKKIIEAELDA